MNVTQALSPARLGTLVTAIVHAGVLAALLAYAPARSALLNVAPIMVDWIAAPKAEPTPEPPRPRPAARKAHPVEKPSIAAAPPEVPPAMVTPAAPPPPPQAAAVDPAPAQVVLAPIFNADYLQNPAPAYPLVSRRLHEQGRVILRVLVNPNGIADEVQLRTSSGSARLDESALQTVKRWKFVPAKRGADPVPAWVLIPISFKLEG